MFSKTCVQRCHQRFSLRLTWVYLAAFLSAMFVWSVFCSFWTSDISFQATCLEESVNFYLVQVDKDHSYCYKPPWILHLLAKSQEKLAPVGRIRIKRWRRLTPAGRSTLLLWSCPTSQRILLQTSDLLSSQPNMKLYQIKYLTLFVLNSIFLAWIRLEAVFLLNRQWWLAIFGDNRRRRKAERSQPTTWRWKCRKRQMVEDETCQLDATFRKATLSPKLQHLNSQAKLFFLFRWFWPTEDKVASHSICKELATKSKQGKSGKETGWRCFCHLCWCIFCTLFHCFCPLFMLCGFAISISALRNREIKKTALSCRWSVEQLRQELIKGVVVVLTKWGWVGVVLTKWGWGGL